MAFDCTDDDSLGVNPTYNIPIKQGFPLSTACERTNVIGQIPVVLSYPGWTLKNGATMVNRVSPGGIINTTEFFKSKSGCFQGRNGRLAGCADC